MNVLLTPPATVGMQEVQRLVLDWVSWDQYEKFLEAVGERRIRLTYDRGRLEFMTISPLHERLKHLFALFLTAVELETGIRAFGVGSTTFRRRDAQRGLEPDECYYLQSASRVRDMTAIDLAVDPPPDLAIEIDVTRSALDRLGIYAALGIPELWRFDGQLVEGHVLGADQRYERVPNSAALPFLLLEEVGPLLVRAAAHTSDAELLREAQIWLRQRVQSQQSNRPAPPAGAPNGAEGQVS